jgi:hypothetical protein
VRPGPSNDRRLDLERGQRRVAAHDECVDVERLRRRRLRRGGARGRRRGGFCARTPGAPHRPPANTAPAGHRHLSRHRSRDLRSTLGGMRHSLCGSDSRTGRAACAARSVIKCLFHFDDAWFAILIVDCAARPRFPIPAAVASNDGAVRVTAVALSNGLDRVNRKGRIVIAQPATIDAAASHSTASRACPMHRLAAHLPRRNEVRIAANFFVRAAGATPNT